MLFEKCKQALRSARGLEWLMALAVLAALARALLRPENASTDLETRLSKILSAVEGAGKVQVWVTERDGAVVGALVVAQGADRLQVSFALRDAVGTLLNLDASQIEIIKMKGESYASGD